MTAALRAVKRNTAEKVATEHSTTHQGLRNTGSGHCCLSHGSGRYVVGNMFLCTEYPYVSFILH